MPSGAIILRLNPGKSRRCPCLGEPVCVRDVRVPGLRWRSSRQGEPGAFAPGLRWRGHVGQVRGVPPARGRSFTSLRPSPGAGEPVGCAARACATASEVWRAPEARAALHPAWACSAAGALTHRRLAGGSGWGHCFTCIFLLNYHIPS